MIDPADDLDPAIARLLAGIGFAALSLWGASFGLWLFLRFLVRCFGPLQ